MLGTACGEGGFNLEVGIFELGGRLRVLESGDPLTVAAVPLSAAGVSRESAPL